MGYMTRSRGQSSSGTSQLDVKPLLASGGGGRSDDGFEGIGKTEINLLDLPGSIGDAAGSIGDFLGGAAETIGDVGIEGGPNVRGALDVATIPARLPLEIAGNALGAVGGVELPYLGPEGERGAARTLGDVPGAALGILSLPGRAVERTFAGQAVGGVAGLAQRGLTREQIADRLSLPIDLVASLEQGADPDAVADELVARGAGFSSNPALQVASQFILDPLNFILPGASQGARAVRGAGLALNAGETAATLGLSRAFMGTVYNAASRGLSGAGKAAMGALVGPTTSGVFHAIGTKPIFAVRDGLRKISPAYGEAYDDALARGSAQFAPAVIAREMADEVTTAFNAGAGEAFTAAVPRGADLQSTILSRLSTARRIDHKAIEARVQEMAQRVLPAFRRMTDSEVADVTARKLALITDASPEDAARALGKVGREKAQSVHLAFYGKAGSELAQAKAASVGAKNIDTERLTILAPDTLTDERAKGLLAAIETGDGVAVEEAVGTYEILSRKFGLSSMDHAKVKTYVQNLLDNNALPAQVKIPKSRKNPLPGALGEWRKKYNEFGYEIGFAPEDGWKAVVDDAGEVTMTDPFVHFVDEADPLLHRNPLGRFMDSLFRGVTQTTIVGTAKVRFLDRLADTAVTDAEADRLFGAILNEARERQITPRALGTFGPHEYERIFRDVLGDDGLKALKQTHSPTFLVMSAFEGNLMEIGFTQKVTGFFKTKGADYGNMPAAIAEGIYPLLKFKYRPVFQTQELVESPFWNALRGVRAPVVNERASKLMEELTKAGAEFRYTFEAGYVTHLLGNELSERLVRSGPVGKALSRVVPAGGVRGVKERARVAQVLYEHGDYFKSALDKVNPRLFREMAEAYGTNDARTVAQRFIEERFRLIDDPNAIDQFVPTLASADEQTVMQAFRESWRQSMTQAFKTHYFSSERSWIERSINHPYLGLYPASYMWGKVAPEFARFLVRRPFGLDYPLGGLVAYQKVQEALVEEHTDTGLPQYLRDNPDSSYFLQMLLPGLPDAIPVNAPAWARHIAEDAAAGRQIDPEQVIGQEARGIATYASPAGDAINFAKVGGETLDALSGVVQDLQDTLTRSAAEYDGQFAR